MQLERLFGEEVYRELEDYLKYLCSFRASTDQLAVCKYFSIFDHYCTQLSERFYGGYIYYLL